MNSLNGQRWPVGTIVADIESDSCQRIVLGYKQDGKCMTALVRPPWDMDIVGEIQVDPVERLREVSLSWSVMSV